MIGLFYGLRRSEICGLKWSAIRNGNIYIEHTITRVNTVVAKDYAKTDASKRHCALLPEIKEMFDQIRQEQERNKLLFGNKYRDTDYIFVWQDGRPITPDYLSKSFRKIMVPMMLPGVLAGAIMSWITLISELSSSIILYTSSTSTLTVAIYAEVIRSNFGNAAAYSTILTLTSIVSLLIFFRLTHNEDVSV